MRAWRGIAVQVVRRNPRAVLVYLAVGTHDGFYTAMGFVNAGEPVEYPYLEEPDQGRPWVQPKILEGEALARLTANVHRLKIETADNYRTIRFDNSDRLRPAANRYPPGIGEMAAAPLTSDFALRWIRRIGYNHSFRIREDHADLLKRGKINEHRSHKRSRGAGASVGRFRRRYSSQTHQGGAARFVGAEPAQKHVSYSSPNGR